MSEILIKQGQVESVEDNADGLRIKVRLSQDGSVSLQELPYAFPLLPKTIQSVPKIGEGVFVFTSEIGNNKSNRFYIGPIISQPQFQSSDSYSYGRGSALSLLQGGAVEPLAKISNYAETEGAFPNVNDIAIVGRNSEDITLKKGEIDIRCGIRETPYVDDTNLIGEVVFNKIDPAYLQLKYKKNLSTGSGREANSMINLVADKINIISHKDKNSFNLTDKSNLINDNEIDDIMSKLHQLPYGDELLKLLTLFRQALLTHVHPYPLMPTCVSDYVKELSNYDMYKILSEHVRIS
jgi:hypothetical protein